MSGSFYCFAALWVVAIILIDM